MKGGHIDAAADSFVAEMDRDQRDREEGRMAEGDAEQTEEGAGAAQQAERLPWLTNAERDEWRRFAEDCRACGNSGMDGEPMASVGIGDAILRLLAEADYQREQLAEAAHLIPCAGPIPDRIRVLRMEHTQHLADADAALADMTRDRDAWERRAFAAAEERDEAVARAHALATEVLESERQRDAARAEAEGMRADLEFVRRCLSGVFPEGEPTELQYRMAVLVGAYRQAAGDFGKAVKLNGSLLANNKALRQQLQVAREHFTLIARLLDGRRRTVANDAGDGARPVTKADVAKEARAGAEFCRRALEPEGGETAGRQAEGAGSLTGAAEGGEGAGEG